MSVEVSVKLTCDGCGAAIEKKDHRCTQAKELVRRLKREARGYGWLALSRGRYRTEQHFCRTCADRSPNPAPPCARK